MDALKALAGQQGCSVDGTAAVSRNPLSQFVNQVGKDAAAGQRNNFTKTSANEIEQAMAAGMGLQQGPAVRGPAMMNPDMMVSEFTRMQQRQHQQSQGPIIAGPGQVQQMHPNHYQQQFHQQQQMQNNNWVNQFESMKLGPNAMQPNPMLHAAYQQNFGRPSPMGQRWASQMAQQPRQHMMDQAWKNTAARQAEQGQNWANQLNENMSSRPDAKQWINEVKDVQREAQVQNQFNEHDESEAIRRATADLVNVMSSDPKFQDSNFFQEMQKVAAGESVITNNEIKTAMNRPPTSTMDNMDNMEQVWKDVEHVMNMPNSSTEDIRSVFERAYQDQLDGKDVDLDQVFNNAFNYSQANSQLYDDSWQSSYNSTFQPPQQKAYELQSNNKYSSLKNETEDSLFDIGMALFKKGELKNAILAFEAVLDKDVTNSEAWRMLGVIYQESDQDRVAITCLENAIEQDPYNLPALLGLGVSYVNELDQSNALKNLKTWVVHNPRFAGIKVDDIYGPSEVDFPNSRDLLMHDVMMLMTKVQEHSPNDADVQEVLGVLFNVSRDYDQAVKAFQRALSYRPDDYSLWNKLGATLANSSKSSEALPHYTRALELKPRYARGWLNFGISHSNLGDYKKAIRAYLRALDLNPEAIHIWNYLRICLTCLDGFEYLLPEVENRNIDAFRKAFEF